jgi:sodium/potassium-transporting ATPase subunit alpha
MDATIAIALTYKSPEADILLRWPCEPKIDQLINWKLMLQSYRFISIIKTICSFAMAYWYL